MAHSDVELAIVLRIIHNKFIKTMDDLILSGVAAPSETDKAFIEGMETVLISAESLSGFSDMPPEVQAALIAVFTDSANDFMDKRDNPPMM